MGSILSTRPIFPFPQQPATTMDGDNMTTSLFEYDCEAVRVRARRAPTQPGEPEEHRKFSVDPNLTSYDILRSILTRAFDLGESESDFIILFNSAGEWMPLLSDWDLDVAILSAAQPSLNLMVRERRNRPKRFGASGLARSSSSAASSPSKSPRKVDVPPRRGESVRIRPKRQQTTGR